MRRSLLLLAAAAPLAAAQGVPERLDALVRAAHDAGRFDGIVLAAEGDRVLYHAAFGEADRTWGVPLAPDTRVPIASLTKAMTAVVAMQLAEAGVLALDAPVGRYAPGVVPDADRITVRYLLQHRSGLPDLDAHADALFRCALDPAAPDTLATAAAVVAAFLQGPLEAEPGTAFRYNNGDTLVLALAIEGATGQPFETVFAERLLAPLGMDATAWAAPEAPLAGVARGYAAAPDGTVREVCAVPARYGAGGGLVSTAGDVLRFSRALLGGRLLGAAARDTLWASSAETGYAALGVWTYAKRLADGRAVRVVERQGATGAVALLHVLLPESDRTLFVARTAGDASLDGLAWQPGLADALVHALFGLAPPGE